MAVTWRSGENTWWLAPEELLRPAPSNFRSTLAISRKAQHQASTGPRSPEISTFYTIIKQWEFDHFELLDCCVARSSTSSDSNSTSKASYGSRSVVCTHRIYSVAKGSATMYALCVQRGEEVNFHFRWCYNNELFWISNILTLLIYFKYFLPLHITQLDILCFHRPFTLYSTETCEIISLVE